MIQQQCSRCGSPIEPGDAACVNCGMPLRRLQGAAAPNAAQANTPARARVAPLPPRPPSRRRLFALGGIGALLILLIVILALLVSTLISQSGGAALQPTTTGAHITSIQTGTGFDTTKSSVTGQTQHFQSGQAVFVVFTVVNQNPNAQVVLKLFQGSALEMTSKPLTPDVGTNIYADYAIVHKGGAYTWEADYNGTAEARISFNVSS